MRATMLTTLAGALALALAGCTDSETAAGPGVGTNDRAPELSVVTFGLTPVGDPAVSTSAQAINELGQIVLLQGPEPFRPWLWTNGSFLRLLAPPDPENVRGRDVNAAGTVVGEMDAQAAAWVNGELTLLQVPPGLADANAFAINDAGQIVGSVRFENENQSLPVFWPDKDHAMAVLAGGHGLASDINNAGEIVGISEGGSYWAGPNATPQPVRGPTGQPCGFAGAINDRGEMIGSCNGAAYWSSPGANALLIGEGRFLHDINELGQIVGNAVNGAGEAHPTLWQREGSDFRAFDLGLPSGENEGLAAVLNNHGQVAGSANRSTSDRALLWQISVRVPMDVVPGAGSSIKLTGSGDVSVALLGSIWLRAEAIDPGSLTLGNDNGTETPVVLKKNSPAAQLTDLNRDGDLDLVADFPKQAMIKAGDLVAGSQVLIVQGRLRDGTRLRGADQVTGLR